MMFDPNDTDVGDYQFSKEEWNDTVYGECHEYLPPDALQCRGPRFNMRVLVDADHARDSVTRRSRTGFIIYLNSAPIYWTSNKHDRFETSSFASEFIAMKNCCEYTRGLLYKLRMMVIPCDLPAYIYGNNQSILVNYSKPFSMTKKKYSLIAYHFFLEGVSKDEWRVTYISTYDNVADILKK